MRHHDSYVTGPVRLCGSAREPASSHWIDPTGIPVGHRYDISFCYATPDKSSKSYAIKKIGREQICIQIPAFTFESQGLG